MAISASYVVRETVNNLKRNLVMTIGAMLTGAVSLALMGGVLLSRQAVNKQTAQWKGGVELSIFMKPDASGSQVDAKDVIEKLVRRSNQRSRIFLFFAAIMVMSAVLLIGTTIRLAIHARQREVAVMKLVGATNWFIRVPFMLEGMIEGLVGAVVA